MFIRNVHVRHMMTAAFPGVEPKSHAGNLTRHNLASVAGYTKVKLKAIAPKEITQPR